MRGAVSGRGNVTVSVATCVIIGDARGLNLMRSLFYRRWHSVCNSMLHCCALILLNSTVPVTVGRRILFSCFKSHNRRRRQLLSQSPFRLPSVSPLASRRLKEVRQVLH